MKQCLGAIGSAPFLGGGGRGGVTAGCDEQLSVLGREPAGPQAAAVTTHPFQVTDTPPLPDRGTVGHRCATTHSHHWPPS